MPSPCPPRAGFFIPVILPRLDMVATNIRDFSRFHLQSGFFPFNMLPHQADGSPDLLKWEMEMQPALKVRICTDALIAPLSDLGALYLKIDCPDGSQLIDPATARGINEAVTWVREKFGIDALPAVLAEIEHHASISHPYALRMPSELLAMIEPVAEAAE